MDSYNYPNTKYSFRGSKIVSNILYIITLILAVRIFLKIIGASLNITFVKLIYSLSNPLLYPFTTILKNNYASGNAELAIFLGMIFYLLLAAIILRIFLTNEVSSVQETQEKPDLESPQLSKTFGN